VNVPPKPMKNKGFWPPKNQVIYQNNLIKM